MTLESKNPLPIGRYWVDVPEVNLPDFQAWLADRPTQIHVESTDQALSDLTWYLFEVKSPVPWFGPGTPTIAESWVHSRADTVQRPPAEMDPLDQLYEWQKGHLTAWGQAFGTLPTALKVGIWGAVGIGAAYVIFRLFAAPMVGAAGRRRGRARTSDGSKHGG
jgi:hypothetical protein